MTVFAIAHTKKQYLTYILSDSKSNARLEVVPERGGIITRLSLKGKEILYLDEKRFADASMSVRGGIPILFPICGNLPDNTYTHHGQSYTLKQHGFARDLPWEVIAEETEFCASLSLSLESNTTTYKDYPFNLPTSGKPFENLAANNKPFVGKNALFCRFSSLFSSRGQKSASFRYSCYPIPKSKHKRDLSVYRWF